MQRICTYTHDSRDRQTKTAWNDNMTPDTSRDYFANGLLKFVDNGVSRSDYTYNSRNLLKSESQTLSGQTASHIVQYEYDADGLRMKLTDSAGRVVDSNWTSRAELKSIAADGLPVLAEYTYNKAGQVSTLTHENSIREEKSYDDAGQLLHNKHFKSTSEVAGHRYVLDATGRRKQEFFFDGETPDRDYGYDDASQVTSASYGNSKTDSYQYDAMGNRVTASMAVQNGQAATHYTANSVNQYSTITDLNPIVHDANGNLTQQDGVKYEWDAENRLLAVTPMIPAAGSKSLIYTYDGQHRRVTRTIREYGASGWLNLETSHFIHDGWNVIEEYRLTTSGETLVRNHTWGQDLGGSTSLQAAGGVGGLLMTEEISTTSTTAYHYHYDGNGNVTEVTDANGNEAATYRYDVFGNTLVANGSYAEQNRYRFSTKPLDSEVPNAELYYYTYRYYHPKTGRWPSRDPIEEEGGDKPVWVCL